MSARLDAWFSWGLLLPWEMGRFSDGRSLTMMSSYPSFGRDFYVWRGQRRPARRGREWSWEGWWEKDHPAMHVPARKSSPKGWVRWDKKKMLSTPFGGFLSDIGEG